MEYLCPVCKTMVPESHFACSTGATGGRKSRRSLSREEAKAMVARREQKRQEKATKNRQF